MFNAHDTREIKDAVLNAAHDSVDLEAEHADLVEAVKGLGIVEKTMLMNLEAAINAMVAEAIDQAFWLGFQAGQRPAAMLGLVEGMPTTVHLNGKS